MNRTLLNTILAIVALLLPNVAARADYYGVTIDDIIYNLYPNKSGNYAYVSGSDATHPTQTITGDVQIPSTVTY